MLNNICFVILLAFTLCSHNLIAGYNKTKNEEPKQCAKYVKVPKEMALPVILLQPECPLKIEDVTLYFRLDGTGENRLTVKNKGTKPIQKFSYGIITGSGGSIISFTPTNPINIGEISSEPIKESQIIPFTDDVKKALNINNLEELNGVPVFIITEVKFMDGSEYNDLKKFEILEKFYQSSSFPNN